MKLKTLIADVILHSSLIFGLIETNKYNSHLMRFIGILTIISSTLVILGYLGRKGLNKKQLEKVKKAYKEKNSKIWRAYQFITNISLTFLFIFNGFILTALLWSIAVIVNDSLKKELLNKNARSKKNKS